MTKRKSPAQNNARTILFMLADSVSKNPYRRHTSNLLTRSEAVHESLRESPLGDGHYIVRWEDPSVEDHMPIHVIIRNGKFAHFSVDVPRGWKPPQDSEPSAVEASPSAVDHPPHYNQSPSGIECIDVVRYMNFNRGNTVKYVWRAGEKVLPGETKEIAELRDLEKAKWYLEDEISRLKELNSLKKDGA